MNGQGLFSAVTPEFLADPYRFYRMLSAADPVMWMPGMFGLGAWLVTSHAVCSSSLRGKHFIKEGARVLPPPKLARIPQENTGDLQERRRNNMLFRDPPDHTRLRSLVSQAFTPRHVERLRPRIAAITDKLVDALPTAGAFDLLREVAFPIPVIVIAELLGVPAEDRDRFKAWSTHLTLGLNPGASPEELADVAAAIRELDAYLEGVVAARRRDPRADLISDLIRVQEAGDKLSDGELVATSRLLLTAGHETTVNLIGNGMLALLRHPGEHEALARDPSLVPNAVEELLRYDSPVQMTVRFAAEDTPLGRHTAKRGDVVLFLLGAANRDADEFPDPERLDVRRANAHNHLSLGGGIHYCLGAPLARLEGAIAIGALVRKAPAMKLVTQDLTWRKNVVLRGLAALPVTA
jgi:cytochrome P450